MTCEGANTECYDDHGNITGVCKCQVGYINETEITTNTDCKGKYLLNREQGNSRQKGKDKQNI